MEAVSAVEASTVGGRKTHHPPLESLECLGQGTGSHEGEASRVVWSAPCRQFNVPDRHGVQQPPREEEVGHRQGRRKQNAWPGVESRVPHPVPLPLLSFSVLKEV